MKTRYASEGIHLFDRETGLNVLLDECCIPESKLSAAPANVSIALTNSCNLNCRHCFAPKENGSLDFVCLKEWLKELESSGCLGVGFGGGEPLLYHRFFDVIRYVHDETNMACTVTTNGTLLNEDVVEEMARSVDFLRISTNGRSVSSNLIRYVSDRIKTGVNVLLNSDTISGLKEEAERYAEMGVQEILLLPQVRTPAVEGVGRDFVADLEHLIQENKWPLRLSISAVIGDAVTCSVRIPGDRGLRQYAHISAAGVLKPDSLTDVGVRIGTQGVVSALKKLERLI